MKYLKDEVESRYIPADHRDTLFSVKDYDSRTMEELSTLSQAIHDSHLTFELSNVAVVVVKTVEERQQLAAQYPKLRGKIRIWGELPKAIDEED